jgi:hypothetical protein
LPLFFGAAFAGTATSKTKVPSTTVFHIVVSLFPVVDQLPYQFANLLRRHVSISIVSRREVFKVRTRSYLPKDRAPQCRELRLRSEAGDAPS